MNTLGIAYWHQFHQQTCVVACHNHQIPLFEINIPFRERQAKFLLPNHVKLMGYYAACSTHHIETATAIANIQSNLIRDKKIYAWDLVQEMLVFDHPITQWQKFLDHTVKTLGNCSATLENHVRNELTSVNTSRDYIAAKIFIKFGGYDLFKNFYVWHFTMNRGIRLTEDKVYIDVQTRYRNACLELIHRNPAATKTDLWKLNAQCARWLTKYDSTWLTKLLPNKKVNANSKEHVQRALFTKRILSK